MSIQAVAYVLEESRARAIDRLVLVVMANHTDGEGFCGISKATLARETGGISEASVRRSWAQLRGIGEIMPADDSSAPEWWLSIDPRRRPRLWKLCGYLGRQSVAPSPARGVSGVSQGRRSSDARSFSSVVPITRSQPKSAQPKPVEHCPTCGKLTAPAMDCRCPQTESDTA